MNKLIFGVALSLISITITHAQTIGSIGLGDMSFNANGYNAKLGTQAQLLTIVEDTFHDSLSKTRKLTVLDRDELTSFLGERKLKLQSYYDPIEKNSQVDYQVAGLDYILRASVTDFDVSTVTTDHANISTGRINIRFDLLGIADATVNIKSQITSQTLVHSQLNEQVDLPFVVKQTIDKGVTQAITRLLMRLYPVRVVALQDNNHVRLNYGDGFLHPGDRVELYQGTAYQTFDELGNSSKKPIAILEIQEVYKRFSSATAISGLENIQARQIGAIKFGNGFNRVIYQRNVLSQGDTPR